MKTFIDYKNADMVLTKKLEINRKIVYVGLIYIEQNDGKSMRTRQPSFRSSKCPFGEVCGQVIPTFIS